MIRRAEEKDVPKIMDLLLQVCMVHHNGRPDIFKGPATKYTEEQLKAILADENKPVFVYAGEEDEVLGYAFCIFKCLPEDNILTDIKSLYIDDLCVDETQRGKGIGKALYEYVLGYAEKTGCYNVTLNVWACNESARRFYEGLGLVPQKIGMEKILYRYTH
ncbi:MAG: GNAT family N-acetyltransferase [Lachnospiraceae bacterium]|nr:GNAT family N-acetyltransferase [Lachnospiraceae bacterium]